MKTPLRRKKWLPGIPLSLLLAALLFPWATTSTAKPRPLAPPWPEFGLIHREGFDQPYKFPTNQTIDAAIWTESWTGWSMHRQGTTVAPWMVPMVVSNSFRVEPEHGAIRFWYRPDQASGTGSGTIATLLELTASNGKTSEVWWSLVVSPKGDEVHLVCQTESGPESCLSAAVNWDPGSWHMLTLGFTPTNSAIYIDDQLAAVGAGLVTIPKEAAPYTSLIVGSVVDGSLPAQGQIEELCIFSGRKKMQQIMGNIFGLSVDWEIGLYYASLSKTAALGPISDEEIAARAARAAQRKAEREALGIAEELGGGMQMMLMSGPTATCVTNSRLYITNTVAWFDTNALWTVQFDVQGTNSPVDIFGTTNLSSTNWFYLERGPSCATYQYTNQAPEQTYYILGDSTVDSDGDGLPDSYEKLISHSDPYTPTSLDSDGDGLSDAWELANGYNPTKADTDGNGIPDGYEDKDGDGLANLMETAFVGNPVVFNLNWRQDADGAGIPDSISAVADAPPFVTTFDKCPLP